jgi:RNA polymerase sigma-70 factor (ECF subfamily)
MSRLHRGRKQLREKLADYARELGYQVAPDKEVSPDNQEGGEK